MLPELEQVPSVDVYVPANPISPKGSLSIVPVRIVLPVFPGSLSRSTIWLFGPLKTVVDGSTVALVKHDAVPEMPTSVPEPVAEKKPFTSGAVCVVMVSVSREEVPLLELRKPT